MAKKKEIQDHDKNGYDEPDFSDPEGFVDDIPDEELCGDILRTKPKETDGVENVIVVDGLPVVGPDRIEKLKGVVNKIFGKFGNIVSEHYPFDENENGKGYIFIEYANSTSAADALVADGHKFDKNHTLCVNLFTDLDKYQNIPDKWTTPEPQPYKDPGNLWSYLMDEDAFDQYLILKLGMQRTQKNDVQIYLNSNPEPTPLLINTDRTTETIAKWSPLGTYLAVFHSKGVIVFGGEEFLRINKFAHLNAEFFDFSPNERYLVTFSPKAQRMYDSEALIIWEIRTGAKKRTFSEIWKSPWPLIRWSPDDKYFGKMTQDVLSIYETPSFRLLENKSLKVNGIKDFTWSPTDNIVAYWVAEQKNVPARVTLLEIPSRNEIRAKNLFSVADCRMHWQKAGDFLCVKVDRYTKAKKEKGDVKYSGMYYNFEIFYMREKLVPVASVEIKEPIVAFAWEPVGNKFAIIHGEQNSPCTSFWDVKKGETPTFLKKFEKKKFNTLFWAPQGQFIVLALLKSAEGPLEFIDTSDFSILNSICPEMTTDLEWDPTGRYIVAAVSAWTGKLSDTGYAMYTFQGRLVRKERIGEFANFFWRPRPPCLLKHSQIKEIKKNLKEYSAKFEHKDKTRLSKASKEMLQRRTEILDSWTEFRNKKETKYKELKPSRMMLRNNKDTDGLDADKDQMCEEEFEVLIKEDIQPFDE